MPDPEDPGAAATLDEAWAFLREAQRLQRAGFSGPALRSAYYSMFHAARALLLSEGSSARTHRGVLSEVNRLFVRGGHLDPELAGDLARVQSDRLKSDYEPGLRISEEDAAWALERAERFIARTVELLDDR